MMISCSSTPSSSSVVLLVLSLLIHAGGAAIEDLIQLPSSRPPPRAAAATATAAHFSLDDYGARGDGRIDDTEALREAWRSACSSRSDAVLEIPRGKEYLVKPIDLGGPCKSKLTLLVRGTIIAPSDPEAWSGLNPRRWLYFHGTEGLVVGGGGAIVGMGQKWWELSCKSNSTNPCRESPTALTFHRMKHLEVQELSIINSQRTHLAFSNSFHVRASSLTVVAPAESPNTDGIHISSSSSVLIEDSTVGTGDDCVSIVGNSSDVWIRNIACGPGHGISVGSLGKNNSMDHVTNVRVEGVSISNTTHGARIKTWQGGRGEASNIVFRNIIMRNASNPIVIDQYYCDSFHPCRNQTSAVKVRKVSFIGIGGTSATKAAMSFACSDASPCDEIILRDISLSLESGDDAAAYCWKASGWSHGSVLPAPCFPGPEQYFAPTGSSYRSSSL